MANRKFLIESILGLAQKIGANPNKFMGTKTNINFLGTGNKEMKGTTFSGQINDDFLNLGFGKDDMIKIIEQDAGYVSAGKLNDSQLNTMFNNLKMIDETFSPPPGPMNVIDLETGTGGINKQVLESLRETEAIKRFEGGLKTNKAALKEANQTGIRNTNEARKAEDNTPTPLTDKISKGINRLKVQKTGFAKRGEVGDSPAQALDRGFMEAEGARRAVLRQTLLKDENALKSLPDGVVDSLKYSRDLQGIENRSNDPLILFRAIYGDAIDFNKIDDIIASEPFGDANSIADKVLAFLKQGDNFADGGRIGYRSGGIGRLMSEGIKTALKRTRKGYDYPGADFQVLTEDASYLMSPPNMQMLEKLKIVRRQLVRDIKRKEGGGKYTYGPDPKATKKDLQSLDEYIADLKDKIKVEGYYGEGAEAEKALLESDSSLPFSKLVKDRYRSANGGRIGYRSGKSVKDGIAALLKLGNKEFGKDTIKIADEIDRPESALLRDEFAAFNTRFNERNAVPAMEGRFTKAEFVIQRMENSIKNALGKTDADSKYVQETFPGMIKELKAKPELGNNPNVWKAFSEDLPKNQRVVVYGDDSVSFFQQTERGPQNIKLAMKFAEENNISVKEASRILKMEPEDQILEITRLKATRQMKKGGLAQILEM